MGLFRVFGENRDRLKQDVIGMRALGPSSDGSEFGKEAGTRCGAETGRVGVEL